MSSRTVINQRNGSIVALHTRYADSWVKRLIGLLSESRLEKGHGLWLLPCNSIHTIGMRFPIDVVFLDEDNHVKKLKSAMRPFRLCRSVKGTYSVLELPSGTITTAGLHPGDKLLEQ